MESNKKIKFQRQLSHGLPTIQKNGVSQTIIINIPQFNINYIGHSIQHSKSNPKKDITKSTKKLPYSDSKKIINTINSKKSQKNLQQFEQLKPSIFLRNGRETKSHTQLHKKSNLVYRQKPNQVTPKNKPQHPKTTSNPFQQNILISKLKTQKSQQYFTIDHNPSIQTIETIDSSKLLQKKKKVQFKHKYTKHNHSIKFLHFFKSRLNNTFHQTLSNQKSKNHHSKNKQINHHNQFSQIQQYLTEQQMTSHHQKKNQHHIKKQLLNSQINNNNIRKQQNQHIQHLQKSIQKINQNLRQKQNNYFNNQHYKQITTNKMEMLTTAAHIPYNIPLNKTRKNSPINLIEQYDFKFDDDLDQNYHSTTARRIKPYENK